MIGACGHHNCILQIKEIPAGSLLLGYYTGSAGHWSRPSIFSDKNFTENQPFTKVR